MFVFDLVSQQSRHCRCMQSATSCSTSEISVPRSIAGFCKFFLVDVPFNDKLLHFSHNHDCRTMCHHHHSSLCLNHQYVIRSTKIRWLTYKEDMEHWHLWDEKEECLNRNSRSREADEIKALTPVEFCRSR